MGASSRSDRPVAPARNGRKDGLPFMPYDSQTTDYEYVAS